MNVAFELKNLSLSYRDHPVIRNMNAQFYEGRIYCLVGASGSGKSTLLRTLNRLNDFIPSFHRTGEVIYDGRDIYSSTVDVDRLRQKIGMVLQEPCIYPKSIYDNVLFGLKGKGKKEYPQVAEEMLRAVFLWREVKDRLNKSAVELSLGQQQRLCIARALAVKPEVLLLDEPTSSLDHKSIEVIEGLLTDLKKKIMIIMATHKRDQVERVADDVISIPLIDKRS